MGSGLYFCCFAVWEQFRESMQWHETHANLHRKGLVPVVPIVPNVPSLLAVQGPIELKYSNLVPAVQNVPVSLP